MSGPNEADCWEMREHRRHVYDGWRLMMALEGGMGVPPVNTVVRTYTWALDVARLNGNQSRDRQGADFLQTAGGIGGLLATYETLGTPGTGDDRTFVYCYVANGNVGQLVDWSHDPNDPNGAIVATYQYDPCGNIIAQSGSYAAENPLRYSTKYYDAETGLSDYGHRYYHAGLGRWLSRDPIGEYGGPNLYGFVGNSPVNYVDYLGYMWVDCPYGICHGDQGDCPSRPGGRVGGPQGSGLPWGPQGDDGEGHGRGLEPEPIDWEWVEWLPNQPPHVRMQVIDQLGGSDWDLPPWFWDWLRGLLDMSLQEQRAATRQLLNRAREQARKETGWWHGPVISATGGHDSWFDDEAAVNAASRYFYEISETAAGTTLVLVFLPGGGFFTASVPAGAALGTLSQAAESGTVVSVIAEAATGAEYRGGIKLTISVVWQGRTYIRDVIVVAGKVMHQHWKSSPPWPPVPPLWISI